jgi:hypothetical protein
VQQEEEEQACGVPSCGETEVQVRALFSLRRLTFPAVRPGTAAITTPPTPRVLPAAVLAGVLAALSALSAAPASAAEACPNQTLRQEQRSTALPDCRAYELVSPPEKGGSDVIRQTSKSHVATDGDGVTFSAVGAFGETQGTSFDSEFLSRRTAAPGSNGWSTSGINPPGGAETFRAFFTGANVPTFVNAFTPDLSTAIYRSWRPLTDAPNVAEVSNLYRINGLGSGAATAQLMSDGVAPVPSSWPVVFKELKTTELVGSSTDLSHVVFESQLNLTADAPPEGPVCAAFGAGCPRLLYENANGAVRLVGRIPNAPDTECDDVNGPACVAAPSSQAGISQLNQRYSQRMVSADGRRIFFQVSAGEESGAIYLREDGERTVELAENGELWSASTDGSRAFFTTSESLLPGDADSNRDLYMYDANAPAGSRLTLVSASSVNDGVVETVVGASDDGQYVYFVCDGQLVAGEPSADLNGLYVWHDGSLAYIGHMLDVNEAQANGPRASWTFVLTMIKSRLAPDGRHLLFMTHDDAGFRGREGFGGYDHAGREELYLYSADTNRLVCASCNPSGKAATTNAELNVKDGAAVSASTSDLAQNLSDDGRYVFFTTAEALVPADTNGVEDAYEYDTTTGSVHLLSSGTDTEPSVFIDASSDGSNAFFVTRSHLVGWDTDNSFDLYDARVNGGFAEPVAAASPCTGETCLPQNGQAPAAGSPSSATFNGAGNLPPATSATTKPKPKPKPRCPRNTVARRIKGHARCVRRHPNTKHKLTSRASSGARNHRSGR